MRKILFSPGFGAGWSTWNSGEVAKLMLEYQPIIEAIERGEKMGESHPAIQQLKRECSEKFGVDYVCVLGADQLQVATVSGPIRLDEYDGSESYEEPNDVEWV